MNLDALTNRIKLHEGYSADPYKDHLGFWTVGYGHLIHDYITSHARHDAWLEADISRSVHEAQRWLGSVWDDLSDTRREVVVELFFQLGGPRARSFKRFKAEVVAGDLFKAALELRDSRWYQQVPVRAGEMIGLWEKG